MDAEKLGTLLEKYAILLRESYDVSEERQKGCDLTDSQCHTLVEIGKKGDVALVELAAALGLDASTLSRTIQSLVVLGLVTRTANEKDRRYVKIGLSPQGRKVYESIVRLYAKFMTRVLDEIPAKKRAAVLESIGLFADAMQKVNRSGRPGGGGRQR